MEGGYVANRMYALVHWQVALFSGNSNNGTNDSGFYWNLNNASSNANPNICTHVGWACKKMIL